MLEIDAKYHCMQFQGKQMIQTQANGEKSLLGPDLGPLNPNLPHPFFSKLCLC